MESTMHGVGMIVVLATIQMGMRQLLRIMTGLSTALQATLARPNTIHLVHMYRDVFRVQRELTLHPRERLRAVLAPLESTRQQLRRHARIVLLENTRQQLRRHARVVPAGNTITTVMQRQLARIVSPGELPQEHKPVHAPIVRRERTLHLLEQLRASCALRGSIRISVPRHARIAPRGKLITTVIQRLRAIFVLSLIHI